MPPIPTRLTRIAAAGAVATLAWFGMPSPNRAAESRAITRGVPGSTAIQGLGDGCDFVQVAAGASHSLALESDGTVWAWGNNAFGELGDGTRIRSDLPVAVAGLPGVVTQVAAGRTHSLALMADGTIWAWGGNSHGQLGDGSQGTWSRAVPVAGLIGVTMIAAGDWHSLALMIDGSVRAWGANSSGLLGDGSWSDRRIPVAVIGLTDVVQIGGGSHHSLAVRRDGTVAAWGANWRGQLGDGTFEARRSPVAVPGLEDAMMVAAGANHSLALRRDGTVRAWGENASGQLGDGSTAVRTRPVPVVGLVGAAEVACGANHSLARVAGGRVRSWGANGQGQLGDGTTTARNTPVTVLRVYAAVGLSAGAEHALVLLRDGTARSWGANRVGQLADATKSIEPRPAPILGMGGCPALQRIVQVSAGSTHSLILLDDGSVDASGANGSGQLGDGTTTTRSMPTPVRDLADVIQVEAGGDHSVALLSDGTVREWGRDALGRIVRLPTEVDGLVDVIQVSTSSGHALALLSDGTVRAWGKNQFGQLGDGLTLDSIRPVSVAGLFDVVQVAAGTDHSLALLSDGSVMGWGNDDYGQIGVGSTANSRATPVAAIQLADVRQIAAGLWNSLALLGDGTVRAWGYNGYGQLGNGTFSQRWSPTEVAGLTGVIGVDAHSIHSAALLHDGTVWAWGSNLFGQCGDGLIDTLRPWPGPVDGLAGTTQIEVGGEHSLALQEDGTARAWGQASGGQTGNGYATNRSAPIMVTCPGSEDAPPAELLPLREVPGLMVSFPFPGASFMRRITWTDVRDTSTLTLAFEVAGGFLEDLWRDRGFAGAECVASHLDDPELLDLFSGGGSRWYLVTMRSPCTPDEWGQSFAPGGVDPRAELGNLRPCP